MRREDVSEAMWEIYCSLPDGGGDEAADEGTQVEDGRKAVLGRMARAGFPLQYCKDELPYNLRASAEGRRKADAMTGRVCGVRLKGFIGFLAGDRGSGKTMAACRLARMGGYGRMWFFEGDELYRRRLEEQDRGFGYEAEFTRRLCSTPRSLLVVDELQRGFDAGDDRRVLANEFLERVVNGRYNAELDTLLIANWRDEGVRAGLPASIRERMRQRKDEGRGFYLICDWGSLR